MSLVVHSSMDFLIQRSPEISCIDALSDRSLLVIRKTNVAQIYSIKTEVEDSWALPIDDRVIACKSMAETEFLTLDSLHVLRLHNGSQLVRTIFPSESDCLMHPDSGVEKCDFNPQLNVCKRTAIFRVDHFETTMALESKQRRVYYPVTLANIDTGQIHSLQGSRGGSCVSYTVLPSKDLVLVLYKPLSIGSDQPERCYIDSVSLVSRETVSSVRIAEEFLSQYSDEPIGLCTFGDSVVGILTTRGCVLAQWTTKLELKTIVAYPSNTSGPQTPPRSPKIHPGLNVVRKHSEVRTVPFLEESLVGLSLSQRESQFHDTTGTLVRPIHISRDPIRFCTTVDGTLYMSGQFEGNILELSLARPCFEIFSAARTQGTVNQLIALERGSGVVTFSSDSNEVIVFTSDKSEIILSSGSFGRTEPVGISSMGPLLASLRAQEIQFHFRDSVQASLDFDCAVRGCSLVNMFSIAQNLIVLTSQGYSRVVLVSEASTTVSIVSLETGDFLKPPKQIITDVTDFWKSKGLLSDIMSVGVHLLDHSLVQVTRNSVMINGHSVWSTIDSIIVSSCLDSASKSVVCLTVDGQVLILIPDRSPSVWHSNVTDASAVGLSEEYVVIGSFDGQICVFNRNGTHISGPITISDSASLNSIEFVSSTAVIAATRDGLIVFIDLLSSSIVSSIGYIGATTIVPLDPQHSLYLVFGDKLNLVNSESLEVRSVELGHSGPIGSVLVDIKDRGTIYCYFPESERIVGFRIDQSMSTATYTKSLPFNACKMVAGQDQNCVDIYIIGSLDRIGRSALFILLLDKARVGLVGMNDAVSVSGVLPFNEVKEEPVAINIWDNDMFPDGGLVAVGTKAQVRGRLILFDRESMHAIAKTSVPSSAVHCICPLSRSILVIGCDDCVALVGLRPGPRTMPVVLFTIASFTTYESVLHVSKVDNERFLVVTERGSTMLLAFVGETVVEEAELDSRIKIVSACHVFGDAKFFVCSSADGKLLIYKLKSENPVDAGIMPLVKKLQIGSTIQSSCLIGSKLELLMSNGSIVEVSPDLHLRSASATT